MSSMTSVPPSKQAQREELAQLCEGVPINRTRGSKVTLVCACGHRRWVSLNFVQQFSTTCPKCGAKARVEV